jgi:DNA primase
MSVTEVKTVPILNVARRLGIELTGNKAHCFVHEDSTPSLSFNEQGNYFKCFGCGVGGSTIDLVKLYLGVGTNEAIQWIRNEYGLNSMSIHGSESLPNVPLPGKSDKTQPRPAIHASGKTKRIDGREFSPIYRELLQGGDLAGAEEYLHSRGIDKGMAKRFGIRVVEASGAEALLAKYGEEAMLRSGLYTRGKKGNAYYSLTRHRLVIPYLDQDGKTVLTLQGRDIDGASNHKYQMLPGVETALYNLRALEGAETIYLCEGAMDVLSALQLGLGASLGVAGVNNFKDEYYELLDPYNVIIASDVDGAGKAFYLKVKARFLKQGKRIKALDWVRLKQDCGVTDEVKDLNDVARLVFGRIDKPLSPKRIYSHLVKESYSMNDNGISFESGVRYEWEELEIAKGYSEKMLGVVHLVKKFFNGRIIA